MSRKEIIDALVYKASATFKSLLAGDTKGSFEIERFDYLVAKYSLINEAYYYIEIDEPIGVDTKQRYIEKYEMYKLLFELLVTEVDKSVSRVDILK